MLKRLSACLMVVSVALATGGCWNYRGLDQMNIVVGMAVDFDTGDELFDMCYEVANLTDADKERTITGRLVRTQGKTLFDAARNAKLREADRLFFGSPDVLIISQHVAREMGMLGIIDWFLRDGECRETIYVAISQADTAREILESPEELDDIMSTMLHDIIREDKNVTATSQDTQLYQIYNALNRPGSAVALPALRHVELEGQMVPELHGTAVIKGERLVGFLTPNQSRYMLMVEDKLGSCIINLSMDEKPMPDISLEVFFNEAKKSYTYEAGKLTIHIKTTTHVAIAENNRRLDMMDEHVVRRIEAEGGRVIKANIEDLLNALQHELNADVLGFAAMIYKKDFRLWQQMRDSWDDIFAELDVEVESTVRVMNSAFIK